jgi:hypothetical protein
VRIVAGEHEDTSRIHCLEYVHQVLVRGMTLQRLGGEPQVVPAVLARSSGEPRYLRAQRFPLGVQTPHQGGQPRDAPFNHNDPKTREAPEYPLGDEAH